MDRVIGIGNALTDILVSIPSDDMLSRMGLPRGSMCLVDAPSQLAITKVTAGLPRTFSLGGSAGNTIRAMARLGDNVGFIGKVGGDNTGDFYLQALDNLGISPVIFRGRERSGRCISLVSPDGERTMATFLGASLEMEHSEVKLDHFTGYHYLYIEGYLVQNHDLIRNVVMMAKKAGLKVAIDLASFNVVRDNFDFLHSLAHDYVDIIFANEQEAEAFTGQSDPRKAVDIIAADCSLAVVKIGTRGAYIRRGDEDVLHVGIMAAAKRVDTTGAGDYYAAGFLYGLCSGLSLRQCGTVGAILAGKVIEVVGTTFGEEVWGDIEALIDEVRCDKCLF